MDVQIRKIAAVDYLQAIDVIKRSNIHSLGKIYPKKLIDEFCKKYDLEKFKKRAQEIQYFVAEDVDTHRILGIIGLKDNELRTFFVDPKHQGKGIGRKLYNRLEKEAREEGIKELILEGSPLGEPIYKHLGFKKMRTIYKERINIKYTDAYMKKVIS
jgi:GNAT superfamily N-acetyltransferase